MATLLPEEEEQDQGPAQQQAGAPDPTSPVTQTTAATAAPGQGSAAAGAATPAASGPAAKPTSSGAFTDVGKYYEAGKKSAQDQSAGLAGQLGGQVQSGVSALKKAGEGYREGLGAHKAKDVFSGQGVGGVDAGAFGNIFKAKDLGTANYGSSKADIEKASKELQATDTFAGQRSALERMAADVGGYSAGEGRLDTALTGRSERDTGSLAKAREQYAGATGEYDKSLARNLKARQDIEAQRSGMQQAARKWLGERGGNISAAIAQADEAASRKAREGVRERFKGAWDARQSEKLKELQAADEKKSREAYDERRKAYTQAHADAYMTAGKAMLNKRGLASSSPDELARANQEQLDLTNKILAERGIVDPGAYTAPTPATYELDRDFESALTQLGGQFGSINDIRAQANLTPELQARADQFKALRGLAGGDVADLGSRRGNSGFDETAAQQALLNMIGHKKDRETLGRYSPAAAMLDRAKRLRNRS